MDCLCGCGEATRLASRTIKYRGIVRGKPLPYIEGHEPTEPYRVADDCWLWNGLLSSRGYPRMRIDGQSLLAHRIYYAQRYGPIPEKTHIHHTCKNLSCVNPEHLEALAPDDHKRFAHSTLTLADVARIRALATTTDLSQRQIGERFGVSPGQISKILRGERWGEWA